MPRRGGWRREGSKEPFRYFDARGNRITDPAKLERLEALAIPPAWQDVWISPRPTAKLQATGIDAAGRKQYLYHADFRAQQEQAKFDKLIRFAEQLPDAARSDGASTWTREPLAPRARLRGRAPADQPGLVPRRLGALRARVADLRRHDAAQAAREGARQAVAFSFRGEAQACTCATAVVDDELADAMRELLALAGGARLFRYEANGELCNLTARRLNDYIARVHGRGVHGQGLPHLGRDARSRRSRSPSAARPRRRRRRSAASSAVDAARSRSSSETRRRLRARRTSARRSSSSTSKGERSRISGRAICASSARAIWVSIAEEQALLSLLRSWRIRRARAAA